ncbi:hypothetical protein Peur_013837 [Populus x canadensis]
MGNQKLIPKAKGWLTHPRKAMVSTIPHQHKQNNLSSPPQNFIFLSYTPSQNCYLSDISYSLSTTLSFDRYASRSSPSSL